MTTYVRNSGSWREVFQPFARTGGAWREVYNKWVNQSGTWRLVFPDQGSLWLFGDNSQGYGGLGNNTASSFVSTPITTFAGGTNWKQVASGGAIVGGVKSDGTLWVWGQGNDLDKGSPVAIGRLGNNNGTTIAFRTPITTFAGGTNWRQVSCGFNNAAAVKTDGTLWIWGVATYGNLGNNSSSPNRLTPVTTFAGGTNWRQVSCGANNVAAIKTDGTLWVWGRIPGVGLGNNDPLNDTRRTPVTTFAGGTNWKQVACGANHVAAIKTDGTLWIWGFNGQNSCLGTNDTANKFTPVTTFVGGTNWKQVSCGNAHTAAIKTDGTLWTWGRFGYFLGINSVTDSRLTPTTTFAGGTNWKEVACRATGTSAIKTDGTLWTWGSAASGALGNGSIGATALTPITTFAGGTTWRSLSDTSSASTSPTVAIRQ